MLKGLGVDSVKCCALVKTGRRICNEAFDWLYEFEWKFSANHKPSYNKACDVDTAWLSICVFTFDKIKNQLQANCARNGTLLNKQGMLRFKFHLNCMTSLMLFVPFFCVSTLQSTQFMSIPFRGFSPWGWAVQRQKLSIPIELIWWLKMEMKLQKSRGKIIRFYILNISILFTYVAFR